MKCVDNQKTLTFILFHFKMHQTPGGSRGLGLLPNIFIVLFMDDNSMLGFSWGNVKR